MDYNLYLILGEADLGQACISEIKTDWEGQSLSYAPRRFLFEGEIRMIELEDKMFFDAEDFFDENRVTLKVAEELRDLEWEANKETEKLKSNVIVRMLQKICQLDKFVIYIFEDDEVIDRHIQYTDKEDDIELVRNAFNWETPHNIKIFSR